MQTAAIFERYRQLQRFVGWSDDDVGRVLRAAPLVTPHIDLLVDDFYAEIERHPDAAKVISEGRAQVERLKGTLREWLAQLLAGRYDQTYVARRWRVGLKHVEIGLAQVYTNAALSRLRNGIIGYVCDDWTDSKEQLLLTVQALNRLLDLDLAIIEDAYQTEYVVREQRAERLITIGKMAGGLAHELRNPLNVVKTSVYYLTNARQASPEKVREHLERIERQVGLADRVITALSDYAKLPLPEVQGVPLPALLDEVLDVTPRPDSITIERDYQDAPPALADARQLLLVFGNLIRNAIDAMPEGGRLRLRVWADEGRVAAAVEDTGLGIARDDLRRILEPLYSTKARGIGLGLALAKSVIDNHRGTLEIDSQLGQGSRFSVWLAAAPPARTSPGDST